MAQTYIFFNFLMVCVMEKFAYISIYTFLGNPSCMMIEPLSIIHNCYLFYFKLYIPLLPPDTIKSAVRAILKNMDHPKYIKNS